jgi:hypothetical protein
MTQPTEQTNKGKKDNGAKDKDADLKKGLDAQMAPKKPEDGVSGEGERRCRALHVARGRG